MFKLPVKLLDQLESMTPEQQEEVVKHMAVMIEVERHQQEQPKHETTNSKPKE